MHSIFLNIKTKRFRVDFSKWLLSLSKHYSSGLRGVLSFIFLVFLVSCASKKDISTTQNEVPREVQALFLDASKEKLNGNYDKAIDFLKEAEKRVPKNAAIAYELSQIYTYKGSFTSALNYAEKAVDLDGQNEWYLLQLAYLYRSNSLHKEALEAYEKLHALEPKNLIFAFSLAEAYLYVGKSKEAIKVLDDIEAQMGVSEEISYQKRDLYLKMGDKKSAIKTMESLVEAYPDNPMFVGGLAETHQSVGNLDEAKKLFKKVLAMDPDNGVAHFSLFQLYANQNDEEAAISSLKQAFLSDMLTIDLKIDVLLKMYEMNVSEYNKASYDLLDILVQIHPEDAKTFSIYGDFLNRDNRIKEAVEKYKQAVKLDPSKFTIWNEILLLQAQTNQIDSLEKSSAKAIELFPTQPSVFLFNGLANLQLKNYEKAIESLNAGKALVLDDKLVMSQFYQYLAEAYHHEKEHKKSDENFDNYLKIDPNNASVLNNYSYYLSLRKEKLNKAEEMMQKVMKMHPNNATFLDTYGWVLYQKGDYAKAKETLKKALNNGGSSSGEVLEHYGDALFQLGEKEEALNYWKKALEKGDHSDKLQQKIEEKRIIE